MPLDLYSGIKNDDNANGFAFDTKTGDWISAERMAIHMQKQQQHPEEPNSIKYVKLFTETTANAIIFSLLIRLLYQIKELFVHSCMHLSKQ